MYVISPQDLSISFIFVGLYSVKWFYLTVSLQTLVLVGESMADHLTVGFICI